MTAGLEPFQGSKPDRVDKLKKMSGWKNNHTQSLTLRVREG